MEWTFIGTLYVFRFGGKAIHSHKVDSVSDCENMRMYRIRLFDGSENMIGMWDATDKLIIKSNLIYFSQENNFFFNITYIDILKIALLQ